MHAPVLLHEVITFLNLKPGAFIVDGTVDGGGHAAEIIKRIAPGGKFLGIDWDENMATRARERIAGHAGRLRVSAAITCSNYKDLPALLEARALPKADGLLLDLGFSSEQLESSRGFSFMKDEPLRMTYTGDAAPVRELLLELSEKELAEVIFRLSGERFSRKIARAIKAQERIQPIGTTKKLRDVIARAVPKGYERGRIDPATRTFQALRIYANQELENLREILAALPEMLASGGRVVVISFHSLEDRIVKQAFAGLARAGRAEILTKKPITARREELRNNPRSRSAKLRAIKLF